MNRKAWKKVVSVVLMTVCVACLLAGCKKESAIVGTWKLETMTAAGATVNLAEMAESTGVAAADMEITLTADKDGKATMVSADGTEELSWKVEDGKTMLEIEAGEFSEAVIEKDKLTITESLEGQEVGMTFAKEK